MSALHGGMKWLASLRRGNRAGLQPPLVLRGDILPFRLECFQGTFIPPDLKPPSNLLAVSVLVKTLLVLSEDLDVKVECTHSFFDETGSHVPGCSKHLTDSLPHARQETCLLSELAFW